MLDHGSRSNVITPDRGNGATAFGSDDRQIGAIDHLVVDEASGKITDAVMSLGGVLGLGQQPGPIL